MGRQSYKRPLAALWFLTDQLIMPLLQNNILYVLLLMFTEESQHCILPFILYVYEQGEKEKSNPMTRLANYVVCQHADPHELQSWSSVLPREFLFDMTLVLNQLCDFLGRKEWGVEDALYVDEDGAGKRTVGYHANEASLHTIGLRTKISATGNTVRLR